MFIIYRDQKDSWERWCNTATNNKPEPVNYDFPEPIFDDEIDVGWDILTYLHKAAEYENGRNGLEAVAGMI